ncbi:FAD-dependent monooxygenase [Nocardia sp. NBC_01327]|uniref:FAD-dependent monooxygenase n=1 Tax=Nocardia sp. NBC_01327 TaxID=2903593 RepID=UPI002E10EB2F|nr:FAD-dependent monooxygenase [Nocardia sp. NBC_01327]
MSGSVHALVCGGGIAGNAVALQLLRSGIDVTVVERASAPRPGGQGVSLRGAGRAVAERMGLMPGIRRYQLDERGMVVVDERGRTLASISAEQFGGDRFLADIELNRGDLNRVLLEEIAALPVTSGVLDYRYGEWVEELDQDSEAVKVRFASGAVHSFDVVIGADGLHSEVRERVFGPREHFTEYLGAYVGFFTMPTPPATMLETAWGGVYPVPANAVGMRPHRDPSSSTAIINMRMPVDENLRGDTARQQRLISDRLAGHGWVVPAMLDAMADAPDFYFDEMIRVRMPSWSRGRIVLLGDAAYCGSPMTGLGATLALVGAYLLAAEISTTPDNLARAFDRYEELLRPLASGVQKGTEVMVRLLLPRTRPVLTLLLTLLGVVVSRPMGPVRTLLTRLLGTRGEYRLPDYPSTAP